ncbi:MAG: hypothetical protein IPJ48_12045 [Propionivibrio sp.]|uniref:DUF6129 domain-containing protein n=1 Tax=Candidatus Propionivibrio dominans TaxID=2954373 RepID=A0A9D7I7Y4_9RHOO|nr:hypothetical protein [Candidatus Propionivibrio dominans]
MITPCQLVQVGEAVRLNAGIAQLRQRFPELYFSECSDDDVSPCYQAALSLDSHHLYLVTGASGHCLELTSEYESASGILLAARVDEE